MAESEQKKRKASETGKGEADSSELISSRNEELSSELDELLDEIDEVLEENAEEFVKNYVQKGGE
jgi:ubiquitin-like protein Pup